MRLNLTIIRVHSFFKGEQEKTNESYLKRFVGFALETWRLPMHLFVECPFSRAIWERVAIWSNNGNLHPSQWNEAVDVKDWFLSMIEGEAKWSTPC